MIRPFTDPVVIFAVVVSIILLAPMLMRRLRTPGLIGLILSGAIVGPSGLRLLERDATIELLGTVGLLYLMFSAGLSMDIQQFIKSRTRSVLFGVFSFIIPQSLGFLVGFYFLGFSFLSSLLLGSIVGSHTLLAFPSAKKLGIAKNRAVTMSLGGTIITDVFSLTALAVVVALDKGNISALFWARYFFFILCFLIFISIILPRIGRWFFHDLRERGDSEFSFLLVALFLSAAISEVVGLAPIVGAFAAGLAMNRLVPDTSTLMSRFIFVGEALFIPFFLISVGMLVDFSVLSRSIEVWELALVFCAIVFGGKSIAALSTGVVLKFSASEVLTMIGLTTPQAAATLAVTLVGFDLGLFDQQTVNAVIILMLLSCLIGTILVENYGRRVALEEELRPIGIAESPERILVPLANAKTAQSLMDLAFLLRDENTEEPVYPLAVARDTNRVDSEVLRSERLLSHAAVHAASANIPVHPLTRVDYHISSGISRAIQERRITTVVMGWKGETSGSENILGNIIDELLEDTDEHITVVRQGTSSLKTIEKVYFCIPENVEREIGFPHSCVLAKRLASQLSAELVIVARQDNMSFLKRTLESIKPDVQISLLSVGSISAVMTKLQEVSKPTDCVILHAARKGRISWTPQTNLLPLRFASALQSHTLLFFYPSERSPEISVSGAIPIRKLLNEERVTMISECITEKEIVKRLLNEAFSENEEQATYLSKQLSNNSENQSLEIGEHVMLFHRHVSSLSKAIILFAIIPNGIDNDIDKKIIAIFLSPLQMSTEVHTGTLGLIARSLGRKEFVEKVIQSKDSTEAYVLLKGEEYKK